MPLPKCFANIDLTKTLVNGASCMGQKFDGTPQDLLRPIGFNKESLVPAEPTGNGAEHITRILTVSPHFRFGLRGSVFTSLFASDFSLPCVLFTLEDR
jgi:hypothetical protein